MTSVLARVEILVRSDLRVSQCFHTRFLPGETDDEVARASCKLTVEGCRVNPREQSGPEKPEMGHGSWVMGQQPRGWSPAWINVRSTVQAPIAGPARALP